MNSNNQQVFFALVRAGLWEKDVQLLPYGEVDYAEVMRLAQEQVVVGLVAAGLEHVTDMRVPQVWALQFAGQTIQLEQRNKAMNAFIAETVDRMRKESIYTLLVKGQGIAQCYQKPLWRTSGDIDFFLSEENYQKAKAYLTHCHPLGNLKGGIQKRPVFILTNGLLNCTGLCIQGFHPEWINRLMRYRRRFSLMEE